MKKAAAVLAAVVLVVSLVSLVFAAGEKNVVIKSIDAKTATMVVIDDGKDATMNVDKSVDLAKWKAGDKVMISVDKDIVTGVKAAKRKSAVGC